jgi:hypothetical protein
MLSSFGLAWVGSDLPRLIMGFFDNRPKHLMLMGYDRTKNY